MSPLMPATPLPIVEVLPQIVAHLVDHNSLVLIAPPGAGKTTMVAPALLDARWCTGSILLLAPRRLAARAAAEQIARLLGGDVGGLVGYATRLDSRHSADTRLLVLTQGVFRNRIIRDPELRGVSAVLFDEVHERSLDGDLSLALTIEAQRALRPDLRMVAMSATVEAGRFSRLMDGAAIIESHGQSHPLDIRYVGRHSARPLEEDMARAIRGALAENDEGDVLAFLPGVREIGRTAALLGDLTGIACHPLHGQVAPQAQRAALRPDEDGRRKVILATSIAETSLTIDGVRIVVDSGLSRRVRFDVASATNRLVTERSSQATATQRAGRAARQGPGTAYRLMEPAAFGGMPAFDQAEILNTDLAPLLLDCAAWGEVDPGRLPWIDPPPAAALAEARGRLRDLGAIDASGRLTDHGRQLSSLPLPPALASMVVFGAQEGLAILAAELAVLLSEPGLGGQDIDLAVRHRHFVTDRSDRAVKARRSAHGWVRQIPGGVRDQSPRDTATAEGAMARLIASAFPQRVARRRDANQRDWVTVAGRGLWLDSAAPLASNRWLAVAEFTGAAQAARIVAAVAMDDALVDEWIAERASSTIASRYDVANDRLDVTRELRLGAITLSRTPEPAPPDAAEMLRDAVRAHGLAILPWCDRAAAWRARARFAGLPLLDDEALLASLDEWLLPALTGKRRLGDLHGEPLLQALLGRLSWQERQAIEQLAPAEFRSPAGSTHRIDYAAAAGPTVELRVQALFGTDVHPMVGEPPVPLLLSLTSPAGRPIQTTGDLPGFWRGSWSDVAREMRGRYPKHPWPDQPWAAAATLRTKRADAARRD